jgi:uncharacterized protein YdaU (DUF1376 family)
MKMKHDDKQPESIRLAYYPWYFEDWLCSETRSSMTAAERGIYRDLLDFCWYYGNLPNDNKTLRGMLQVDSKSYRSSIQVVLSKFVLGPDGRYHHPKVDDKRKHLEDRLLSHRARGKMGGLAKASALAVAKATALAEQGISKAKAKVVESKSVSLSTDRRAPKNRASADRRRRPTDRLTDRLTDERLAATITQTWPHLTGQPGSKLLAEIAALIDNGMLDGYRSILRSRRAKATSFGFALNLAQEVHDCLRAENEQRQCYIAARSAAEIERLEGILRDPRLTDEERAAYQNWLDAERHTQVYILKSSDVV